MFHPSGLARLDAESDDVPAMYRTCSVLPVARSLPLDLYYMMTLRFVVVKWTDCFAGVRAHRMCARLPFVLDVFVLTIALLHAGMAS